jgi:tRNA(Ile)-lysidine synthase
VNKVYQWDLRSPLRLPFGELTTLSGKGLCTSIQQVEIRFRRGGEKCGRYSLKNRFQEWGVPPWMRDRIPLLFVGETLAAVVGFFVDERFVVEQGVCVVLKN